MKVLLAFGTRPEAIKMAPIINLLKDDKRFITKICITTQHQIMLDQVLRLFNIKPDYDLNIMIDNQDLYDITIRTLLSIKDVLYKEEPDVVLVQGDTSSAFAVALASFYTQIPVGHVEAGLRTGNLKVPFPEEANRSLIGKIADLHFAPTQRNYENLLKENVPPDKIFITGNTIIDALFIVMDMIAKEDLQIWKEEFGDAFYVITDASNRIILVTAHRRESFGEGFFNICKGISLIAEKFPDIKIIYPVHLNPNVRKTVMKLLSGYKNIYLIDPVSYAPFVYLMSRSYIIITDSGGIQEEAPSLGKPVLVIREVTERLEAVEAGTAILVGTNPDRIFNETANLLTNDNTYKKMTQRRNPFGDGKASQRIVNILFERKEQLLRKKQLRVRENNYHKLFGN